MLSVAERISRDGQPATPQELTVIKIVVNLHAFEVIDEMKDFFVTCPEETFRSMEYLKMLLDYKDRR